MKNQMTSNWQAKQIKDLLDYERPDKYIVENTYYIDSGTPVLTANKSFILGYTDEETGIYDNVPAIIFDDFTTDSKFVDFPFKVKSSAIKILKEKSKEVDIRFVFERMKSINFPTGNHKRYYISQYQNMKIAVPSLPIQKKISNILSTIDEAIQKTDQIIKKTKKLKQGLMNELLTKGIGHKKFKKTKIGEIPKKWKVTSILDSDIQIIDGDRGLSYPNKNDFSNEGYCLFLSARNFIDDHFDFREYVFISKEKDNQLRKGKLKKGDVVLTTRGTVGSVAIYNDSVPFEDIRINSGMLIFRAEGEIDNNFLYFLLKSPYFKERYNQLGSGSAQPQLPIRSLRNLLIPIPTIDEQREIASKLSFLDLKHDKEIAQLLNLKMLKSGLMYDIFNQKVQIN